YRILSTLEKAPNGTMTHLALAGQMWRFISGKRLLEALAGLLDAGAITIVLDANRKPIYTRHHERGDMLRAVNLGACHPLPNGHDAEDQEVSEIPDEPVLTATVDDD